MDSGRAYAPQKGASDMPRLKPISFRATDAAQLRDLELLAFVIDGTTSDVLCQAVDRMIAANRETIDAIAGDYDRLRAERERLRETAQELRGEG